MSKVIIYQAENGIAVMYPCECGLTIEQIAQKDVPAGVKYRIIDANELPSDRSQREAWTADLSTYDGIGGQS